MLQALCGWRGARAGCGLLRSHHQYCTCLRRRLSLPPFLLNLLRQEPKRYDSPTGLYVHRRTHPRVEMLVCSHHAGCCCCCVDWYMGTSRSLRCIHADNTWHSPFVSFRHVPAAYLVRSAHIRPDLQKSPQERTLLCAGHGSTHRPPARPDSHHEQEGLYAALEDCAIPSRNQSGLAVSPPKAKPSTREVFACNVGQKLVTITTPPPPTSPKRAASVVPASSLSRTQAHVYRALPPFGFRNPAQRCSPDHGRSLRAQASTRPLRWALSAR